MKDRMGIVLAVFMAVTFGCAPQHIWTSGSAVEKRQNETYAVSLAPVKQGHDFFSAFQVRVQNQTDRELKIDWNQTRYVHNGKPEGGVVFAGIDPGRFRSRTVPPDTIPPHGTLARTVAPARTIAWTPLREERSAGESQISPGMLPPGDNGIRLVVIRDGQAIPQTVTVEIFEKEAT